MAPGSGEDAARPGTPLLRLEGVSKRFGSHAAVDDVSLDLGPGEVLCLLGPSGCGKSTLLRLVAGFEAPSGGRILLDGADIAPLPPHRRPVNMMFQSYALFPHLSVEGNLAYGLKGLGRAAARARVAELLRLVRLEDFGGRRPDTLSGGQRQRVALARALAREPRVLLLDEPLGALDRGLREETQGELRALQRRLGTSFVVVTHDPAEAMALADRIAVMEAGRLVEAGPPTALYERPGSRFVAGLLGDVNLIPGRLGAGEAGPLRTVETALGPLRGRASSGALEPGAAVLLALRPERVRLGEAGLPATVTEATFLGERVRCVVRMGEGTLVRASLPAGSGPVPAPGAMVRVGFDPDAATVLPA
ncbi:ABC transporter ATP-binding protein [Methylobacterium sp. A54F]